MEAWGSGVIRTFKDLTMSILNKDAKLANIIAAVSLLVTTILSIFFFIFDKRATAIEDQFERELITTDWIRMDPEDNTSGFDENTCEYKWISQDGKHKGKSIYATEVESDQLTSVVWRDNGDGSGKFVILKILSNEKGKYDGDTDIKEPNEIALFKRCQVTRDMAEEMYKNEYKINNCAEPDSVSK